MKILKPINNFIEKYPLISFLIVLTIPIILLVYGGSEYSYFSMGLLLVGGCYIGYVDHKKTQREGIVVAWDFTWMFPKISHLREDIWIIGNYLDEFESLEWGWRKLKKIITGTLGLILMIWMWVIRLLIVGALLYFIYDILSSILQR